MYQIISGAEKLEKVTRHIGAMCALHTLDMIGRETRGMGQSVVHATIHVTRQSHAQRRSGKDESCLGRMCPPATHAFLLPAFCSYFFH
jgi:hypothetical protein